MCIRVLSFLLVAPWLAACTTAPARLPGEGHLRPAATGPRSGTIPPLVRQALLPPPPNSPLDTELYSVAVQKVKVEELLFALARDARLNVDIHPGLSGTVTLNAVEQTLPQLLNRIARQADLRFELDGPNLAVMPDTPFLRNYRVDYVAMRRNTAGAVAVTTQIASAGATGNPLGSGAPGGLNGANNSATHVENRSQNHFWETLVENVRDILRETDKILPDGSSETVVEQESAQSTTGTGAPAAAPAPGNTRRGTANPPSLAASPNAAALRNSGTTTVRRSTFREAAAVIAHPESGIVTVRATSRQHEKIREFLDAVLGNARRQVVIEATVAEVQLNSNYQQGIEWHALPLGSGFRIIQKATGSAVGLTGSLLELGYRNGQENLAATVKLLESFGDVRVLSTPRISVLNNQTAILKVVDNSVYFTIKADTTQNQTTTVTTYTTTLNQVPVGFVMNVTPQISESDAVVLNIRPSISRVIGTVSDPNPALKAANVSSEIPVIRSREMESVLRVQDGNIAVMGGLMEDAVENRNSGAPGLSQIPVLGQFFTQRNDTARKSELVIFLRPLVVREGGAIRAEAPQPSGEAPLAALRETPR